MKNVTFSADETLLEAARRRAAAVHRTLNDEFRDWLEQYAAQGERAARAADFLDHVQQYASTEGQHFSRSQMNER
ncbi:MAG: hypothetical protein ACOCYQ_06085 [Alkalispirochaeta sp.]